MTRTLAAPSRTAHKALSHNGLGVIAGVSASGLGAVGVWLGLVGMFGAVQPVHVGWLLPLSGVYLELDPLGGFFMALIGAVAIPVGVYAIGYAHAASEPVAARRCCRCSWRRCCWCPPPAR